MLVPFVIDVESLAPDPAWTPAITRKCHLDLLQFCQSVGLLVHDGEHFESSKLKQALEGLPSHLRLLWQAMLERSPPVPCKRSWSGSVTREVVPGICSFASAALVDDARAEAEFGLNEDQDETTVAASESEGLAICRLASASHASVFQRALEKSEDFIEAGESYGEIWRLRFRSLANAPTIKRVSIVDRYAVERHFRCPQHRLSGIERFLRLLDGDASGDRYASLFAAWTAELRDKSQNDLQTELSDVVSRLPRGKIRRLEVFMLPNTEFGTLARDRFVRFDRYVWDLGHGLDVFEGPAAQIRCSASFKTNSAKGYKRVESELENHPRTTRIKIAR
jgi:hypothetical protein